MATNSCYASPDLPYLFSVICHHCFTYEPPQDARPYTEDDKPFRCASCGHSWVTWCDDCYFINYRPRFQCWCCGQRLPSWKRECDWCDYTLVDGTAVACYQVREVGPDYRDLKERAIRYVETVDMPEEIREVKMMAARRKIHYQEKERTGKPAQAGDDDLSSKGCPTTRPDSKME